MKDNTTFNTIEVLKRIQVIIFYVHTRIHFFASLLSRIVKISVAIHFVSILLFCSARASIITEKEYEYYVDTGPLQLIIQKQSGMIERCQLSGIDFECDADYRRYTIFFPEFGVQFLDGSPEAWSAPYQENFLQTTIRNTDDDIAILDVLWETDNFHTWWTYTFFQNEPFFKVYIEQEVIQSAVYSNHQQCAMLNPDFDDTYLVDYEGNIITTMKDGLYEASNIVEHHLFSAIDVGKSQRYPMFAWHNDVYDIAVCIMTTYVTSNLRETISYHGGGSTKEHPGFSEVQWNWFGKSDTEALYLQEGTVYGMELIYFFTRGDIDKLDDFNTSLFCQNHYDLELSENYYAASWGGRRGSSKERYNWNFPQASSNYICSQELFQPRAISIPRCQNGSRESHMFDFYCKEISDTSEEDLTPIDGLTITHQDGGISIRDDCFAGYMAWVVNDFRNELEYKICSGSDRLVISGNLILLETKQIGQLVVDLLFSERISEADSIDQYVYEIRSDDPVFGPIGITIYDMDGILDVDQTDELLRLIICDDSGDEYISEGTAWTYEFSLYPHIGKTVDRSSDIPPVPTAPDRHYRLYYHRLIDVNGQFIFAIRPDPKVSFIKASYGQDSLVIAMIQMYVEPGHEQVRFYTDQLSRISTIKKDGAILTQQEWMRDTTQQTLTLETEWNGKSTIEFLGEPEGRGCEISSFTATSIEDYVVISWNVDSTCVGSTFHVLRSSEHNMHFIHIGSETQGRPPYTLWDTDVEIGCTYNYVIQVISEDFVQIYGPLTVTVGPENYNLLQNYPNPFHGNTSIPYVSRGLEQIQIAVYDILGRKTKTLYSGKAPVGRFVLKWDGRDEGGKELSNGIYFCILETKNHLYSKKIVLIK